MPRRSGKKQRLAVSVMYEPHRCQQALVRAAYAQVLPELKRLVWSRRSVDDCQREVAVCAEGKKAG